MRHEAFGLHWEIRNETDKAIIQEVCAQKVYGDAFWPDMKVIDIGAQIGSFSVFAASKGANIVAYEPDPANYATLLENIRLNGLEGKIKAYNDAVWSTKGHITLYDSCSENLGAHSAVFARNPERGTKVPTVTLDDIFEMNALDTCDFLKIDCEGSEFEIMKSQSMRRVKAFSMEVHGFATTEGEYKKFRTMLEEYGFELHGGGWHPVIFYLNGKIRI